MSPPVTIPRPTPRPVVTVMKFSTSRPRPYRRSDTASVLTSLSTSTGSPSRLCKTSLRGSPSQPSIGELTVPRSTSTTPGIPRPTPNSGAADGTSAIQDSSTEPRCSTESRAVASNFSSKRSNTSPSRLTSTPTRWSGAIFTPSAVAAPPTSSRRTAGRPPREGAWSATRTTPRSSSSRVKEVTVAGLKPRRCAIWLRAIGPEAPIRRSTATRLRSRESPEEPVRNPDPRANASTVSGDPYDMIQTINLVQSKSQATAPDRERLGNAGALPTNPLPTPKGPLKANDGRAAQCWCAALGGLEFAPAASAVVGHDLLEHRLQGPRLNVLSTPVGDRPRGCVVVTAGDDPVRIWDDRAVVEEKVDVILGGKQGTDIALEHEIRPVAPLDRLPHLRVDPVDQVAKPATDLLLPVRKARDVRVDSRIAGVITQRHNGIGSHLVRGTLPHTGASQTHAPD